MAVPVLATLLGSVVTKAIGLFGASKQRKDEHLTEQSEINKEELSGAPSSILRLWRSFLGWVLSFLLVWELVGRLVLIPLFWQDKVEALPPSVLEVIMPLLLGMLGLG